MVNDLDLYSRSGKSVAWQTTAYNRVPTDGVLDIGFTASEGEATISTIRFISDGETVLELAASENRRWSTYPLRLATSAEQDVHEVALGRMGTRFFINPVPQLLGWRQSALGTFTEDLGELALAFREDGGEVRCLPFTDRYPLFENIQQEDTLTGVVYTCEDPELPFKVEVKLTAPFYPGEEKLSGAPFFYIDINVVNTGTSPVDGEFLLVRPHQDDDIGAEAPQASDRGLVRLQVHHRLHLQ